MTPGFRQKTAVKNELQGPDILFPPITFGSPKFIDKRRLI